MHKITYQKGDVFYDLEVLRNITTLAIYEPATNSVHIAYETNFSDATTEDIVLDPLTDKETEHALMAIQEENKDAIEAYDIKNVTLDTNLEAWCRKLVYGYPKEGGTVYGFNSQMYDSFMLTVILSEYARARSGDRELQYSTANVRDYSDLMIGRNQSPFNIVRNIKAAIYTGDKGEGPCETPSTVYYRDLYAHPNHIDVQSLNEKLSRVGLKRLSGQGGYKILSSDKLGEDAKPLEDRSDIEELLAYNVSDVINTMQVFENKEYQTPLNLKTRLVERFQDRYENNNVKRDTTSANLITYVIASDKSEKLIDDPVLEIAFPITRDYIPQAWKDNHQQFVTSLGYPYVNLEEANQFIIPMYHAFKEAHQLENAGSFTEFTKSLRAGSANDAAMYANLHYIDATNLQSPFHIARFVYDEKTDQLLDTDKFEGFNLFFLNLFKQIYQQEAFKKDQEFLENRLSLHDFIKQQIHNLKNHPEHPWWSLFFYPHPFDPLGKAQQRVVYKNHQLMIELLNYTQDRYHWPQDVFTYYSAYRGNDFDTSAKLNMKDEVKKHLPEEMKNGADILLPNNQPVYARLSVGGVHGNIIDLEKYKAHVKEIEAYNQAIDTVKAYYQNIIETESKDPSYPHDLLYWVSKEDMERMAKTQMEHPEKCPFAATLARKTRQDGYNYNEPQSLIDLDPASTTGGAYKKAHFKTYRKLRGMNDFSVTVDAKDVVHMDISSYYPTIISIIEMFKSRTGDIDRYAQLMKERLHLKGQIEHIPYGDWTEKEHAINLDQNAAKLLLNAASGKADGRVDNNIRVNNKTMQMRICGQLILTALAFDIANAGGLPNSINTDGIYVQEMDVELADQIIHDWADLYGFNADAEVLTRFISKDANNRIEFDGDVIQSASGGTVTNWKGPHFSSNLSIPAVVDNTLVNYLWKYPQPLETFDREWCRTYITSRLNYARAHYGDSDVRFNTNLLLQNILVSAPSTRRYFVYQDPATGKWEYHTRENRVFYVTEDAYLDAELFKPQQVAFISVNKQNKALKEPEDTAPEAVKAEYQKYLLAEEIALANNFKTEEETSLTARFTKYKHVNDPMTTDATGHPHLFTVLNQSVDNIPVELLDCLDIDAYLDIIEAQWGAWYGMKNGKKHMDPVTAYDLTEAEYEAQKQAAYDYAKQEQPF